MTEAEQKLITRKIIEIDEDLCTGCGNCVVACAEGALKLINGKAKVINEVFCDGLGACIGECPVGALKIIKREALEFDEEAVEDHLDSLKNNEKTSDIQLNFSELEFNVPCGCPSAKSIVYNDEKEELMIMGKINSTLRHWPVQMHLISPMASCYQAADVLISADCVAYSYGNFHRDFIKNKSIAIACPKLDQGKEIYIQKIKSLIDDAKINTLTVATMEVPCCSGLLALTQEAAKKVSRKVPIKHIIVSIKGDILKEEWL
jgi:NAD-dependent dihydropyrimidine dehydrogenase PreA subunit